MSLADSLRFASGFVASEFNDLPGKAKSLLAFRAQGLVCSGTARSPHNLTWLYLGNRTNLSFLLQSVFADHQITASPGTCNIWRAAAWAEAHAQDVDITVFDVPWPYEIRFRPQDRVIEMPSWVRQAAGLGDTWEAVVRSLHRSARGEQMRKIRKNALSAETTTDPAAVHSFYDTMYVPHTRRRFGPTASIDSRRGVMKSVQSGALLQIKKEGQVIAATVLHNAGDTLKSLYAGFASPDLRQLDGATAALYYHSLLYAFENGFKTLDYCGSRPLLDDGVFATKRRWGAVVHDDWSLETLLVRLERFTPAVETFLCDTHLLARQDAKLIGKIMTREAPLSAEAVRSAVQRYVSPGMDNLNLYALRGVHHDAQSGAAASPIPVVIHDLQSGDDSLRTYCDA